MAAAKASINDQWRICFVWRDGHCHDVEIVRYHWEMRRITMAKTTKLLPPVHPGEILLKDFMKPLRLTVNKLAIDLPVPATRIGEIVHRAPPH